MPSRTLAQSRSGVSDPGNKTPDAHDRDRVAWCHRLIHGPHSARENRNSRNQSITAKCLIERGVDDTLVPIDTRDQIAARIEELEIGDGTRVGRSLDLDHDPHSLGRKRGGGTDGSSSTAVGSELAPSFSRHHNTTS